jgi:crotonobetainyl-CoA:carnitine CoA-transferase CaiB-like acyl-CoA transferase
VRALGLDYESLRAVNPKIVCCSLVGFARDGARSDEPGYDYLMQALAGYMSITGDPAGPPVSCGVSIIDHAAGLAAGLGLLAALGAARVTGQGSDVEVGLLDVAISMLTYLAIWNLNRDFQPVRYRGSAHQTLVPAQTFATADGSLVIFCAKEKFWRLLCEAIDAPEMAEQYAGFDKRFENRDEVILRLETILATKSTDEWLARLQGKVPCAPVYDLSRALRDPIIRQREMIVETEHPEFGTVKQVGGPIKVSGAVKEHRRAPKLGEHTDQILRDWVAMAAEDVAELRRKGVV